VRKYQILYLLSSESIVWCRYSSDGGGPNDRATAGSSLRHWPPGTNRKRSCRLFFAANKSAQLTKPDRRRVYPALLISVYNWLKRA
jgi:hypothetical protein